jgi:hypothetical protein
MLNLSTFYIIISPEQDAQGKILINRRLGELRNWYFCSQEYDKSDGVDRKVLEIANAQRIKAIAEAHNECGLKGEFQLAKPKSCNVNAAKRYMSSRIVIVLDEFDIENMTCKIHNGLLCRSIDDDPRIWRKAKWGEKYPKKKKRHRTQTVLGTKLSQAIKEKDTNLKVANGDT